MTWKPPEGFHFLQNVSQITTNHHKTTEQTPGKQVGMAKSGKRGSEKSGPGRLPPPPGKKPVARRDGGEVVTPTATPPLRSEGQDKIRRRGREKVYTQAKLRMLAKSLLDWVERPENLFLKRWCATSGFPPQRISEFAADSEEFARALEIAKAVLESRYIEGGLQFQLHAGLVQFLLSCNYGYIPKTHTEHSGSLGVTINVVGVAPPENRNPANAPILAAGGSAQGEGQGEGE